MNKIDLNKPLVSLETSEINQTIGSIVSSMLACSRDTTGAMAIKYWEWANLLYQEKPLVIDNADLKSLKGFIEGHKEIMAFAKAQVLNALDSARKIK